ncbi:hypothetical protein EG833_03030 [archaeon]|nr:hypothetical protein [archaeon]
MKLRLVYILAVLFIFASCSKEGPIIKQKGEEYFPQGSKGSQWEYLVNVQTPKGSQQSRMVMSIEDEEKINGKTYLKQSSLMGSQRQGAKPNYVYSRRSNEGIYKIDTTSKDKPEYLMTPFPITVGKKWTVKTSDRTMNFYAERVDSIEFLGKTYQNCLKVVFQGETKAAPVKGFTYFAPNIGEVATDMTMGQIKIQYVLNSYKL